MLKEKGYEGRFLSKVSHSLSLRRSSVFKSVAQVRQDDDSLPCVPSEMTSASPLAAAVQGVPQSSDHVEASPTADKYTANQRETNGESFTWSSQIHCEKKSVCAHRHLHSSPSACKPISKGRRIDESTAS